MIRLTLAAALSNEALRLALTRLVSLSSVFFVADEFDAESVSITGAFFTIAQRDIGNLQQSYGVCLPMEKYTGQTGI
jgi:hypothetical protein